MWAVLSGCTQGDAFTRVVYVHPAEQQHFVDRLPTAQTVFAMRRGHVNAAGVGHVNAAGVGHVNAVGVVM